MKPHLLRPSPGLVLALMFGGRALFAASDPIPPLMLGSAWYPEQWPESQWEHDLACMEKAGLNMVRIGEFAWSSLEPSEVSHMLDWMERAEAAAAVSWQAASVTTPTSSPGKSATNSRRTPSTTSPAGVSTAGWRKRTATWTR